MPSVLSSFNSSVFLVIHAFASLVHVSSFVNAVSSELPG